MASVVSATSNPLYFFYDCEGSGGSSTEAAIIQVAAVLYTKNLSLTERKAANLSEGQQSIAPGNEILGYDTRL